MALQTGQRAGGEGCQQQERLGELHFEERVDVASSVLQIVVKVRRNGGVVTDWSNDELIIQRERLK
jgi:hypothetical protein